MDYNKTIQAGNFLIHKESAEQRTVTHGFCKPYIEQTGEDIITIRTIHNEWSMSYSSKNPVFTILNELIPDGSSEAPPTTGIEQFIQQIYRSANHPTLDLTKGNATMLLKEHPENNNPNNA